MTSETSEFTKSQAVVDSFVSALPEKNYRPLPNDWLVAVTDVVQSRKAISEGRYKAVNMAGVSMISAVMNALDNHDIPYIFGGDGAAIAFAPQDQEIVAEAIAATSAWVQDDLNLILRGSIVPIRAIREAEYDVLVASVRVSPAICNYAFIGGGINWAEKVMKSGEFRIERAAPGTTPDLSGLSCRWTPIGNDQRKIVSLIIEPAMGEDQLPENVVSRILEQVHADEPDASPVPGAGPGFSWPPKHLALESKASGMGLWLLYLITLLAWVLDKTGWPLGKFDPKRYREYTALNTDYRKIQDGIRMTISLSEQEVLELRELLSTYKNEGRLRYGICEQDSAVLTCFVPSIMSDNHFHFLDGAGGGYAAAADSLN